MTHTLPLRHALTIIRSFARVFTGTKGVCICAVLLAAFVSSSPSLAQKGRLPRAEVVAICEAGDIPTCTNAGAAFVDGRGGPVDLVQGVKYNKMGCEGGNAAGCANLGILTRDGRGTKADIGEARRLFSIACEGGIESACNDLGLTWADQAMAEPDKPGYFVLATKAFAQACEIGSPEGCSNIARAYYHGNGAEKSYAEALIFGEKACKLRNANGCYTAGVMHLRGEGVSQSFAEWQSYVSFACNLGHAQACTNYGYMYLEGKWGVRQNLEKAREYLTRGCEGGYPNGCAGLEKLEVAGQ